MLLPITVTSCVYEDIDGDRLASQADTRACMPLFHDADMTSQEIVVCTCMGAHACEPTSRVSPKSVYGLFPISFLRAETMLYSA